MKNKKVICAMSGGVDSSVCAVLLKREGFDVVGVFMKFWSEESDVCTNRCCSPESEKRAREVASILGIPFYVFNFEDEFKKRIVDYFLNEYKKGVTPNPCVICNKEIKFGLLMEKALALNADFVASGHYAKSVLDSTSNLMKLKRAKDKNKDQSYFLWMLSQKQLKKVLFPVGGCTRTEVEKMAVKMKLPFKGVKKSQEICFVPNTAAEFLSRRIKENPGDIATTQGKVMGKHKGLWFYTLGQRKGIGLGGGPFYVVDKNLKNNQLVVSREEKDLFKKELLLKNTNWISGKTPKLPLRVKVKIRYRSQLASASVSKTSNKRYKVIFDRPQRAITPGQSAVFYKREELLGGGIID